MNFFEGPEVAARWAERTGIVGTVVGLGEATGRAAREWAPLVASPAQTA